MKRFDCYRINRIEPDRINAPPVLAQFEATTTIDLKRVYTITSHLIAT
jgi:hypothetical protein